MTQDQRNRLLVRLFYWLQIVGLVAYMTFIALDMDGWADWNLLYFTSELLLVICLFPKLVRLEQIFIRYLMTKYGHDT